MQSIQELAAQLKLTYIRDNADEALLRARRTGQSAEDLLGELFSFELERRSENGNTRRVKEAHFPIKRNSNTLQGFLPALAPFSFSIFASTGVFLL